MIQDLRHGMKKVNVEAEVLETPKPSLVHTRYGNSAMVTNAWIADETGKIKLCLWNEQANYITMGDIMQIKNASVTAFKGERQLCLGKTGTVTVLTNHDQQDKATAQSRRRKHNLRVNFILINQDLNLFLGILEDGTSFQIF